MSKGIVFCRDEEELDDAARIMEHKKIRRLPVINKDKRMIGMLSLGVSVFKCFVRVLRFSRREALARFLFEIRRLFAGAAIGAV
jgi:CBS-domain-containing membrane protein